MTVRVQRFHARMEEFPALATFAETACRDAGLGRDAVLRLRLLLEELFTNTVDHGHGGDSDRPIDVALDVMPGKITVVYEDAAPAFDPLARRESTEAAGTPPVGGFGLVLVRGIASDLTYERVADRNRLRFSVHGSSGLEAPGSRSTE